MASNINPSTFKQVVANANSIADIIDNTIPDLTAAQAELSAALNSTNETLGTAQENIQTNASNITDIYSKLTDVNGEAVRIEQKIDDGLRDVNNSITITNDNLSNLTDTVATISTDLDTAEANIVTLDSDVDVLKKTIANAENVGDLTLLDNVLYVNGFSISNMDVTAEEKAVNKQPNEYVRDITYEVRDVDSLALPEGVTCTKKIAIVMTARRAASNLVQVAYVDGTDYIYMRNSKTPYLWDESWVSVNATVNNAISSINSDINSITDRVSTVEGDIVTINGDIDTVNGRIDTTNQTITDLDNGIDGRIDGKVSAAVNTIDGKITTINGNITNINNSIGEISKTVDGYSEAIDSIKESNTAIDGRITSLDSKVTEASNKAATAVTKANNAVTKVNNLETNMASTIQSEVNAKIQPFQSTLDGYNTTIEDFKTTVNESIDLIEDDVSGLDTSLTKLTNTVNEINTDVSNIKTAVSAEAGGNVTIVNGKMIVSGMTVITTNRDTSLPPNGYNNDVTFELRKVDTLGMTDLTGFTRPLCVVMTAKRTGTSLLQVAYGDGVCGLQTRSNTNETEWGSWVSLIPRQQFVTSNTEPKNQLTGEYWIETLSETPATKSSEQESGTPTTV